MTQERPPQLRGAGVIAFQPVKVLTMSRLSARASRSYKQLQLNILPKRRGKITGNSSMNLVARPCWCRCKTFPSHPLFDQPSIVMFTAFRTNRLRVCPDYIGIVFNRNENDKCRRLVIRRKGRIAATATHRLFGYGPHEISCGINAQLRNVIAALRLRPPLCLIFFAHNIDAAILRFVFQHFGSTLSASD
jgi:hypothetical protein